MTNGSAPSGSTMRQPVSPASADSTTACASPPSDRSWAADTSPSRDAATEHVGEQLLAGQVDRGRQPAEMVGGDLRPDRAVELVAGVAEQDQRLAGFGAQAGRDAAGDVVDHAQHADHRGGQDRRRSGLVVEADVAAGDRNAQCRTAIGETADRLGELPHHAGILRRAEVEAVGHRDRGGAGDGDVAVRLGQRELGTGVGVEQRVAARRVGGHRDAAAGGLVDAQHAAVGVLGQHGVAAHVAVVLLGDERPAAQVRTAQQRKQSRAQLVAGGRPRQAAPRCRRSARPGCRGAATGRS